MKTHLRKRWNVKCEPKKLSGVRRRQGGACFLTGGNSGIELPFQEFWCWEVAMSRFSFVASELRRDVNVFSSHFSLIFSSHRRAHT